MTLGVEEEIAGIARELSQHLASERAIDSQALVDVLNRIDRMNLSDIEKRKQAKVP